MPDDISALNDTLNTLNEQRLTTDYEKAQQAHQERPSEGTLNALVEAATAQDRFAEARSNDIEALAREVGVMKPYLTPEQARQDAAWEIEDGNQGNYVTRADRDYAAERAVVDDGVISGRTVEDDLGPDLALDAYYDRLGSIQETMETEAMETRHYARTDVDPQVDAAARRIYDGSRKPGETQAHWLETPAHVKEDHRKLAATELAGPPATAPNFADEVDAWYQAVQPTGEIRRVRDQDLFDRNGYSQQPDAVAVQAGPVSQEFEAMHRPTSPLQRHEMRMQNNPSLATSPTRLPGPGQGPTLPVAAPTMKL